MPAWLQPFPIAVREWKREGEILDKMGVITVADESILATRAYLSHLIQVLAWDIKHEGTTVATHFGSVTNPKVTQLQKAISEHRRIGYVLGLDPSGRVKLHTGKSSEDEDPFEKFNKR